jgi:hypothetical protein
MIMIVVMINKNFVRNITHKCMHVRITGLGEYKYIFDTNVTVYTFTDHGQEWAEDWSKL